MTSTELTIELPKANALQIFTEEKGIDPYLNKIREEALSHVPDITTKTGREQIASIAHKVSKCKTYLEKAGKELCDQERKKIDATLTAVMSARKRVESELDALRDEVRKPLTDYENAEGARKAKIECRIEAMSRLPDIGASSELIQKHISRLEKTEIDESFGEFTSEAALTRTRSLRDCKARLEAQLQIETDLIELDYLRKVKLAKEQQDHEASIAQQAAYEATQHVEREAQAKIDAANAAAKAAEEKERAAVFAASEKDRIAKEDKAKADAEESARMADLEYRQRVIDETVQSFIDYGYDGDHSEELVESIINGKIKNVSIKF